MDHSPKIRMLLQLEKKKWLFLVALVALTHLFCQSLMLPYGNALLSLLPDGVDKETVKGSESSKGYSVLSDRIVTARGVRSTGGHNVDIDVDDHKGSMESENEENEGVSLDEDEIDNDFQFIEDETLDDFDVDFKDGFVVQNETNHYKESLLQIKAGQSKHNLAGDPLANGSSVNGVTDANAIIKEILEPDVTRKEVSDGELNLSLETNIAPIATKNDSSVTNKPVKKKMRCDMPPKTILPINEMQHLLVRNRARSRAMRPRWSSERDQEIMNAKLKIENASDLKNERDLYPPLFRNVSMFKRSYELMEHTLKIYVYKEGGKPIFHFPILKGLYASEGWFMKLMEANKQYSVKDPKKAHLFYMPFSSRMLEHTLYVRNSHNRTNLRQYLKEYSEMIAAKYRFWNRTGGADHFLVACHDWAPYETRHHMEHCIKALCNADVTVGFKIGRDVSLPETYVRSARNPLRDLGGKPPSKRTILSFYAGNMHGYLRHILLKHWQDKEPDMKILGPMPPGVASKMNYIQHMQSSKYCICPKGHEVNSPRIVEAIFYECVPVIISDNFVPPFFEVFNWDAFSVILAEKDIPNLRKILVSISEEKYLDLQLGVRKVQRHFLWHAKPQKYDLFHMTLHSIWYNRVFQVKLR